MIDHTTATAPPASYLKNIPPLHERDHPDWCHGPHEDDELRQLTVSHDRGIGGGFMPETSRLPGTVTRPNQGAWEVSLSQVTHRAGPEGNRYGMPYVVNYQEDPVVVLELEHRDGSSTAVRMLPGEARCMAAALVRGADAAMFSDGQR